MLPTGTLTFLFTDIQGSTRLWEQHPAAMQAAHARHLEIVAQCVAEQEGTLVRERGEGDSCFAVFPEATAAVAAITAIQVAFQAEPWPPETPIRVRAALHSGEAVLGERDYNSSAVNRCARLRAIAHGGQTLLSRATCELARDALPPEVSLRDLGLHRLKDLERPEQVYQLLHSALPAEFPPLASQSRRGSGLPLPPTPLLGRETELATVVELLAQGSSGGGEEEKRGSAAPAGSALPPVHSSTRLVTLTGPGGVGKTRLALEAASALDPVFADGICLIPLAGITDPALVAAAAAQALGIREDGGRPLLDVLREALQERETLLLLDNFEQVIPSAPLVADLLAHCPRLKVLVTSRELLRLRGERELPVGPLPVPREGTGFRVQRAGREPPGTEPRTLRPERIQDPSAFSEYSAVALFAQRAEEARPGFAITRENAAAIAEICCRLDGLPLAIELAAARVRVLAPAALLARLGPRLDFLTGGARDLPGRHQTLRAAIDWSHDLLDETERAVFRRIAVFTGGFTLTAAENVASGPLLDTLTSLADKSLLRQVLLEGDGEPRFEMLETIRDYALERLAGSDELEELRRRHARYLLDWGLQAGRGLLGTEAEDWLARLEREQNNLKSALAWCLGQGGEAAAQTGLQLASVLSRYLEIRGALGEGRHWLGLALRQAPGAPPPARSQALIGAAHLAIAQGDYEAARAALEEALPMLREIGDGANTAMTLANLGVIGVLQGNDDLARERLEEGRAMARATGQRIVVSWAQSYLGVLATVRRELQLARELLGESEVIARQLGDQRSLFTALNYLGGVEQADGNYEEAARLYREGLEAARRIGYRLGIAVSLASVGLVAACQGEPEKARPALLEALDGFVALGHGGATIECLACVASLAASEGQDHRAGALAGAAAALRDRSGFRPWPFFRADHDRWLAAARSRLGDSQFEAVWEHGAEMTQDQAVAFARGG